MLGNINRSRPTSVVRQTLTLDDEQRKAVEQIVSSRDFVTLFRGGAGTGKSYALREVKAGLEKRPVIPSYVIAPQHQQVDDFET